MDFRFLFYCYWIAARRPRGNWRDQWLVPPVAQHPPAAGGRPECHHRVDWTRQQHLHLWRRSQIHPFYRRLHGLGAAHPTCMRILRPDLWVSRFLQALLRLWGWRVYRCGRLLPRGLLAISETSALRIWRRGSLHMQFGRRLFLNALWTKRKHCPINVKPPDVRKGYWHCCFLYLAGYQLCHAASITSMGLRGLLPRLIAAPGFTCHIAHVWSLDFAYLKKICISEDVCA